MYDFIKKTGIYLDTAVESNNMIYSIDMLRLKTYITYDVYNSVDFYFRTYHKDKIKRYWIDDRKQCFKYNWSIEIEEGMSFWFGFCHNSETKLPESMSPEYNLTIEFNPNKLQDDKLVLYILGLSGFWKIVRYDLAIDLKLNIKDLIFDKSGKRKFKVISNGFEDKTVYIGSSGTDKFVKVYNKKHESGLNIVGDLTRVEITKEVNSFPVQDIAFWEYDNFFPDIYLNNYVYSLSDLDYRKKDKTLYAILYAVQNGYPLNDLSRQYRMKIKDLLEGGYNIRFDSTSSNQALRRVILYYFLKNPLVIFRQ